LFSEKIILKPRNIKFKKLHKLRKPLRFQNNPNLHAGTCGLLSLHPIRLKSTQIYKLTLFLKKAVKKVDKTKRIFWFNVFPHFPLTRKPIGARMGKGKGKAKKWFALLHGGTILIEFLHLRSGRALYFFRQISFRLSCKTALIFENTKTISHPFNASKNMLLRNY
jgi:large subunit ribosomal protein L16